MSESNTFSYTMPPLRSYETARIERPETAVISVTVDERGNVDITGNSEGLLYLASYIAMIGLHDRGQRGIHVHLDPEEGELDPGSTALTLTNIDNDDNELDEYPVYDEEEE